MRAPLQEGDFPYPVKYGYCAVGVVEEGPPALTGRTVFALHPHQDRFVAPAGDAGAGARGRAAAARGARRQHGDGAERACGIPAPAPATASSSSAPAWSASSSAISPPACPGRR